MYCTALHRIIMRFARISFLVLFAAIAGAPQAPAQYVLVTVMVAPRVGFGHSGTRYTALVTSDLNYAGHYVWVQRKAPYGSFRNVKRIYLGASSRAVFRVHIPRGRSILRVVLPADQAGPGYVAGLSRLIFVKR